MADVLKIEPSARFKLTRNGINLHTQHYAPSRADFTEATQDRLVLATNMTSMQTIDLGGVTTGEYMLLETDNPILVAVNGTATARKVTVGKAFMVSGSAITGLHVQNESTSVEATVNVVVTD
jgi:hypothetical protein